MKTVPTYIELPEDLRESLDNLRKQEEGAKLRQVIIRVLRKGLKEELAA